MRRKLITTVLLALTLVLCMGITASASFAADQYDYKVMIYSGEQGHFTIAGDGVLEDKGKTWVGTYKPGDTVEVSLDSLGFVLDNEKYYPRGFRIAGHDNDETTGYQNLNFSASEDVSYEIAYGLKGALVAYQVNYVDKDGNPLRKSDTFYGMAGDKPVVSYKYVEGYLPDAYTLGKVLTKDEAENVFDFSYHKMTVEEQEEIERIVRPAPPGTAGNPAGTNVAARGAAAGNAGAGNAGNGAANIGDNQTPLANPDQFTDIDGNDVPKADSPTANFLPILVGSAVGILLLLALLAYFLKKRRDEEEEEETIE